MTAAYDARMREAADPSAVARPAIPRPAATVVLLRPGRRSAEILLTRRPASMAFAADVFVFPGGSVDVDDGDERLLARLVGAPPGEDPMFVVAAIRELFEETGVLLAERNAGGEPDAAAMAEARAALLAGEMTLGQLAEALDLRLRPDRLAPIAHWTTPPVMPRRFDTRFFVAELPPGVEPSFDTDEVVEHRWLPARDALDAMADGEIDMWVPTCATLQQLEFATDLADIASRIVPGDVPAPRVVRERPGLGRVVLGSAGAVPGQTVNAYLVGRREVVVVDPGDPSDAAADAILDAVANEGGRLVAIAITHADPDHAAGAEVLALRLDVPILAGPGAGRDLPYIVRELADGERLGVGDVPLELRAMPGPRPDHVAFILRDGDRVDVLAGDLVGPRASQAILGPPNAAAWQTSLVRLRALHPGRVYPGHGEPFGGVPPDAGPPGQ
jgi:glyoxylase-like metal-dependent hydrolase (beta-lactamase superfamily II)/8-oxo-dGTP pyrophosphatase MutT (NUDIX family)